MLEVDGSRCKIKTVVSIPSLFLEPRYADLPSQMGTEENLM
jgi:hypothetical protein